ncbi:MAG TPA: ribonuclease E/G [Caulobacteraceae bacterium]|jgi:Ribonuclease G/E|nr:ribonuclease E/G [Caulobacteraceae bacterium]
MTGQRRLYIDPAPGEARGVVTLDGKIERLLIDRAGEPLRARLGETWRGRVRRVARGFRAAFIDLALPHDGVLTLETGVTLAEGAVVQVEVTSEARADKGPGLRLIGPGKGLPERLTVGPSLDARLRAFAPDAEIESGPDARNLADEAEASALERRFTLSLDLVVTIERARGMVPVDVDFGAAGAGRNAILAANRTALAETARLIRLKGLGGLIVIDLAGPAKERESLTAAARDAFEPDDPGVVLAGISRLGVLELAKPWRERPVAETLCGPDGRPTARTMAQQLIRSLELEGRADPGAARIVARCAPEVATEATRFSPALGPRFTIEADPAYNRFAFATGAV